MTQHTYLVIQKAGFAFRLRDPDGEDIGIMLHAYEAKEGKSLGGQVDLESEASLADALKYANGMFEGTGVTAELLTAAEWEAEKAIEIAREKQILADAYDDGDLDDDLNAITGDIIVEDGKYPDDDGDAFDEEV